MKSYNEIQPTKVVIQGPPGSGKTTFLINKYRELVNNGVQSQKILVLVANRAQKVLWENNLQIPTCGPSIITSYFGFIQRELRQHWPLVQSQLEGWGQNRLEPLFLTIESSQYLMGQVVQEFREKGSLLEIVNTSDRIAIELIQNLSRGVMGGIDYQEIGERLYNSWENKQHLNHQVYEDLQKAINKFRKICLNKGLLDYSLAIESYNNGLLAQKTYQKYLEGQIKYLLVDNLEESVVVQLDLIKFLLDKAEKVCLVYCGQGGYSRFAGAVPDLAAETITSLEEIRLTTVHTASEKNCLLGDTIARNILETTGEKVEYNSNLILETELRSTLFQKVSEKILKLTSQGIALNQIAVIAPYVDSILEIALNYYLEKSGCRVVNLTRKNRMIDNPYIQSLVTLACLAYPQWGILPNTNDIADTVSLVVGLDPVRSGIIGEETAKKRPYCLPDLEKNQLRQRLGFAVSERYEYLQEWLARYQSQPVLPINSFFQLVFTELLSSLPQVEENLLSCRQLIDSAGQFLRVLRSLEVDDEEDNQKFIQLLKMGIKGAENLLDIQKKLQPKEIILASPYVYLASSLSSDVQIWLDLSSEQWYRSDVQELANVHVLKRNWGLREIWDSKLEEKSRREKAANLLRALSKKCRGKIIMGTSLYSSQGYEQEGWVNQIIEETLQRGEEE